MKKISSVVLILTLTMFSMTAVASYYQTPLPVSKGGTGSASALSNNRVLKSSGGAIVEAAAITANRALTSDSNGIPVASAVTDATLAFLDATSSVQTQLNAKLSTTLASASFFVGNGSNVATGVAMSGDASLANTGAVTLATVNGNVGSFTNASITVNAKGLITAASNGSALAKLTVVDGGNSAYSILAGDNLVRSSTTLTADRAYTLPVCNASNIGEQHYIKNKPSQTFNIILTANGSDLIDGSATVTVLPGDDIYVACGFFSSVGTWDVL